MEVTIVLCEEDRQLIKDLNAGIGELLEEIRRATALGGAR